MVHIADLDGAVLIRRQRAALDGAVLIEDGVHGDDRARALAHGHIQPSVVIAAILPRPTRDVEHRTGRQGDAGGVDAEARHGRELAARLVVGHLGGIERAAGLKQKGRLAGVNAEDIDTGLGGGDAVFHDDILAHLLKGRTAHVQLYDRVDVLRRIAHEERRDIEIVLAVFQRARDAIGVANVGDVVRVRHGLAELNRLTGLEIGAPERRVLAAVIVRRVAAGLRGRLELDGVGIVAHDRHARQIRQRRPGAVRHVRDDGDIGIGDVVGVAGRSARVEHLAVHGDVELVRAVEIRLLRGGVAAVGAAAERHDAVHRVLTAVRNGNRAALACRAVAGEGAVRPVHDRPAAAEAATVGQADRAAVRRGVAGEGAAADGDGRLARAHGVEAQRAADAVGIPGDGVLGEGATVKARAGVRDIDRRTALVGRGLRRLVAGEGRVRRGHGVGIHQVDGAAVGRCGVRGEGAVRNGHLNAHLRLGVNRAAGLGGVAGEAAAADAELARGQIDRATGLGVHGVLRVHVRQLQRARARDHRGRSLDGRAVEYKAALAAAERQRGAGGNVEHRRRQPFAALDGARRAVRRDGDGRFGGDLDGLVERHIAVEHDLHA